MTDTRKHEFELEGADVGLGLRPKNIGARVKRVEDRRLLTGQGAFTDDRIVPGALHVAFRRSDHSHALISSINATAAAAMPGRSSMIWSDPCARHLGCKITTRRRFIRWPAKRSAMSASPSSLCWPRPGISQRTRSIGSRLPTNHLGPWSIPRWPLA